jgi:hypothetical protein
VVVAVLLVVGVTGYVRRTAALHADTSDTIPVVQAAPAAAGGAPTSPLGDLSTFRTIIQDTLRLLNTRDQTGATARVDDLEVTWDNAEAHLRPRDGAAWTAVDGKIDKVLRALRATSPNPNTEKAALTTLLTALD